MAEDRETMKIVDTTERGKDACKSYDITATAMRVEVTPNGKQSREHQQEPPKKSRGDAKKRLKDYFGVGKRIPVPSTEGDPVTTVVQRRDSRGAKSLRAEGASNDKGQNKKPRSDDKDLEGKENKQGKEGLEGEEGQGGFVVDLESMSTLMKKKSTKAKTSKKKVAKDKQEATKKKAMFQLDTPQEASRKKDKKEVAVCFKCVVGFAIQVDKGKNAKGGFNKKISEGLAFLCKYLDKAVCILPSGKDQQLNPIKSKADIPKY
jgi:hypothetical protein